MKQVALIAMMFMLISGCSTLGSLSDNQGELLVKYGTMKFIGDASTPAKRAVRADRVLEIAEESKTFFDDRKLPLDRIDELVRDKIDWSDLDQSDRFLVDQLLVTIKAEIEESAQLGDEVYVTGSKVLGWVIDGAKLAGA